MRVIFLDIAGVLVHDQTVHHGAHLGCRHRHAAMIDRNCVARLVAITSRTGAGLCVISDWRSDPSAMAALRAEIQRAYAYVGRGARRVVRRLLLAPAPVMVCRADEIRCWLRDHPSVTSYAILTDHRTGDPTLDEHLVKTHWLGGGLQDHHVDRAFELLAAEIP